MEMAQIGATPKGGVNRISFTDEDRRSRDLFITWCEKAGLTVKVDKIGNMFARRKWPQNVSRNWIFVARELPSMLSFDWPPEGAWPHAAGDEATLP